MLRVVVVTTDDVTREEAMLVMLAAEKAETEVGGILARADARRKRDCFERNQDNGTDENGGYFPCSFARDVDICSTTGDDRQDDAGCASGTNNGGNGSKSLTQGASHGTLAHRFTSTI